MDIALFRRFAGVKTALSSLAITLAIGCGFTFAQSASADLDVAGLKLGMTIEQAEAALKQTDPGIKLIPLYATDDPQRADDWNVPNGMGDTGGIARVEDRPGLADLKDTKLNVQVGLFGAAISRVLDENGNAITAPSARLATLEGELFYLRFTPTDDGGKLYAVSRYIAYSANAPKKAELASQIEGKYGRPSDSQGSGPAIWLYDAHGKLASNRSGEFTRCRLSDADKEAISGIGNLSLSSSGNMEDAPPDLRTLQLVLSDVEGLTLSLDDHVNVSAVFGSLVGSVNPGEGADDRTRYRKCGIELQTFIRTQGGRVVGLAEELEDVNALYFDNGIAAYLATKAAHGAATPAASTKL